MIHDTNMLKCICQDADMGRAAIDHVMKLTKDPALRKVLKKQESDYRRSYTAAAELLQKSGDTPPHANGFTKAMTCVGSDVQTMLNRTPSKIAELVIQGNTMGITTVTAQLNQYKGGNHAVADLAKGQIDMEQKNIESLKPFL